MFGPKIASCLERRAKINEEKKAENGNECLDRAKNGKMIQMKNSNECHFFVLYFFIHNNNFLLQLFILTYSFSL